MLDNHSIVFNGMMTRLRIKEDIQQSGSCDFTKGFNDMAEELFVQNEVKPNRILSITIIITGKRILFVVQGRP